MNGPPRQCVRVCIRIELECGHTDFVSPQRQDLLDIEGVYLPCRKCGPAVSAEEWKQQLEERKARKP